ncbi:hypothetical protein, partial [Streptomyces scabichelini]|uniref:hypothetical protein n=1 Tax=Streptomyces scabichelini TaxID=2711217 RepID=UPI001F4964BB
MKAALNRGLYVLLIAFAALAVVSVGATRAHAATDVSKVAEALQKSPVYVDPSMSRQLPEADADALAEQIEDADKPVFVAVLPADFPEENLFKNLRTATGVTGLYAIRLGDQFNAQADSAVLPANGVRNLVSSVQGEDTSTQLDNFTDRALMNVGGSAPSSWTDGGDGDGTGVLIGTGVVLAAGGAGAYTLVRRNRRKKEEERQAALDKLRVVVDEDITAFGEELDRLDFHPAEKGADDAMRADYERALDAYDKAKSFMAAARRPEEVRAVTQSLEDGRFSLAVLAARREGLPVPERRAPCFFDPRHGPSVADETWTPDGGTSRDVPVCAADRARRHVQARELTGCRHRLGAYAAAAPARGLDDPALTQRAVRGRDG